MNAILLSLSGGADSATMLAKYINDGRRVGAVFFDYGSKQNGMEIHAARSVAAHYGIRLGELDVRGVFKGSRSAMMLDDGRAIPHSGYSETTMSQTVVPGRNAIFASILASMAESADFAAIALGMHGGDHHLYPDCRPAFAASLAETIALSTEGKIRVETPFIRMSKAEIIGLGVRLDVPYALTRSCYAADALACGLCGTCVERREAFRANGVVDPVRYQNSN